MAIGLYIHIPFCIKKCSYCDFVSFPMNPGAAGPYIKALLGEISLYARDLQESEKKISSIFIGGGTPTCLPAADLAAVLKNVESAFCILPGCEITVEANPGTVNPLYLKELKAAGVNRLSLGIQSLNEQILKSLGRIHSAREAVEAVKWSREAGLQNINLDLICGIPGQSSEDWLDTIKRAVELAPEHIAVYGLQLEKNTPLERAVARGEVESCPEEMELFMYRTAVEFLISHGYDHYEISNFARPGMRCAHNLGYWLNLPYLGLGVGAHSFFKNRRFSNERSVEGYLEKVLREEYPVEGAETISKEMEMSETMFLGLRLVEGVNLKLFEERFGRRAEDVYHNEITRLLEAGLVESGGGRLRLTGKGLPVANQVFREFV